MKTRNPLLGLSLVAYVSFPGTASEVVIGENGPSRYQPLTRQRAEKSLKKNQISAPNLITISDAPEMHGLFVGKKAAGKPPRLADSVTGARGAVLLGSLTDSVAFIRRQVQAGNGLPKSFDAPANVNSNDRVIQESVNLYDSALAIWALMDASAQTEARRVLDIYAKGLHGNMELRAYSHSGNGFQFSTLTQNAYLLFDVTRANGRYGSEWNPHYVAHAGPNAWIVLAGARYIQDSGQRDPAILDMIKKIGDALILLQKDSQGGVRSGPTATNQPNAYNEINVEHNLSAYAAFQALYKVTRDLKYRDAALRIEDFLSQGRFYNPSTRRMQTGIMGTDQGGSLMNVYVRYNANPGRDEPPRWEIEPRFAADSGGTLAISALGPSKIDELFGPTRTQSMWANVRANFGRAVTIGPDGRERYSKPTREQAISGLDSIRDYPLRKPSKEDPQLIMISSKGTAEAVFALQQVAAQCAGANSAYCRPWSPERHRGDINAMRSFLTAHAGPAAVGPGLTSGQAPPESVTAMTSIYATFRTDPLAWARN